MFNLAGFEKKQEELENRMMCQKRILTKGQRDKLMLKIYGKTGHEMAEAYHERVEEFKNGEGCGTPIFEEEEKAFSYEFRNRTPTKEIGQKNGHVSGQTYVPRAVYKSAGVKVGDKPDCWENHKPTHGLEEVPRIHRAPYENPGPILRIRQPEKEISPHMRFQAAVETERINDSVASTRVTIAAPFDGGFHKTPVWRTECKERWVAGKLNLAHGPREGTYALTKSMSGSSFPTTLSISESFSPEIRQVERKRAPDKEIDPNTSFVSTFKPGETVKSKARINWNLESELSAAVMSTRSSRVYSQSTRAECSPSGH